MDADIAAEILGHIKDAREAMDKCDTLAQLLDTKMAIHIGTDGRNEVAFYLELPVIRTAIAGALKANYNLLRDEYDALSKQVDGWQ